MHFKVAEAHRTFFKQNGFIEFESALSAEEIEALAALADAALAKKTSDPIEFCSAETLYRAGHDLWRTDPLLRKKILSHSLAEIGAQLSQKKTLLIAFDQILRATKTPGFPAQVPSSLQSISAIRPLAGAILLHLSGITTPSPFIPSSPQNILFFSPDLVIPWETFFQTPNQSYLLITYATPESLCVHEKKDPHLQTLKKLGYGFGDRLKSDHHPVVFRS